MKNIYQNVFVTHEWNAFELIAIIAMMVVVVVHRAGGARRAPHPGAVRQARSRAARDGGQSTHMPLKVNAGGVIPVIFASSIWLFRSLYCRPVSSRTARG